MRNMNVQKIVKSVIRPLKEFNSAADTGAAQRKALINMEVED